jgi:hypothetical protein
MNAATKLRTIQRLLGWSDEKMRYNRKLISDIISSNNEGEESIDLKDFFTTFPYTNGEQLYPLLKKFIIEESGCYYLLLKYSVVTEQTIDAVKILNATQASVSGFSCKYIYPGATYFPNGNVNQAGKVTGDGSTMTSEILLYYNSTEYPLRQILNIIPANSIQLIATNLE